MMRTADVLEIALQAGLMQQIIIIAAGALVVAGMALYITAIIVRRDRS